MDSLLGDLNKFPFPDDAHVVPRTSCADVDFSDVFGGPPRTSNSLGGSEGFDKGEESVYRQSRVSSYRDSRSSESASSVDPLPVVNLDQLRNKTANARRSGRTKIEPKSNSRPSIYKIPLSNGPNEVQNLYLKEGHEGISDSGGNFHYSVYKWPRTDMSLVIPYHLKKKMTSRRVPGGSARLTQRGDSDARSTKDGRNDVKIKEKDRKDKGRGVQATERKSFHYKNTGKQKETDYTVNIGCETISAAHLKNNVKEIIKIFNSTKIENQPQKPKPRNKSKEQRKADGMEDKTAGKRSSAPTEMGKRPRLTVERTSDKHISWMKRDPASEADASPASISGAAGASLHKTRSFHVEELGDNQSEESEAADPFRERILESDAKIREWSKGKEGNIRSLLSTLHLILWPECGWKPVPLVGIIEGAAVRRAYQKAILCLHPDKLQQKGAEVHQKYVAQMVFDILQEAWTHFNSFSSL